MKTSTHKRPTYIWRSTYEGNKALYFLIRTRDFYRTRINAGDFARAFNTLNITGISPLPVINLERISFDFGTDTLTAELTEKLAGLKKVRVVTRGKLVKNLI